MNGPETRYAQSGDVHIAYQVLGDGPLDLVFVPGWVSNSRSSGTTRAFARFLRRLASFSPPDPVRQARHRPVRPRVAVFTLEQRMDDVRAVMDAVGSERAALFGVSEGGPMSLLSPPPIRSAPRRSSSSAPTRSAPGRPTTRWADTQSSSTTSTRGERNGARRTASTATCAEHRRDRRALRGAMGALPRRGQPGRRRSRSCG